MISGPRLRLARQARGFSQQQLAGMAGVSRQAVSAVESGQSDPSLRVALALARAVGMTVDELFGPDVIVPAVSARLVAPAAGPGVREARAGAAVQAAPPGAFASGSVPGPRVTLAPIGDSFVALPLSGPTASRAGFLPAGGLIADLVRSQAAGPDSGPDPNPDAELEPEPEAEPDAEQDPELEPDHGPAPPPAPPRMADLSEWFTADSAPEPGPAAVFAAVQPIGPPRPTLVVAGCDPALPLLEAPLGLLDPPVAFTWWPCPSREALRLAADGLVHVAGVHLRGRSGGYNTGPASELLAGGGEVIGFSAWQEGLVLRPESAASGIAGVADVVRRGLRLVNREPGAEARRVLDRELVRLAIDPERVPGYRTRVTGHLQVAGAIAAGLADVGVASEPAALAYGLAFIPLADERFDLVIPAGQAGSREVQCLMKVLCSRWLLDQLGSLPGYDPTPCGQHVTTLRLR